MLKLAIVCTHPIQYFAPLFTALATHGGFEIRVFYGWKGSTENALDHGFGQPIKWDIPLLEGYEYEFVENVARDPGSHHFRGIDLPSLCERIEHWQADAVLVYGWSYKAHLSAMKHFKGKVPVYFRGDSTLLDEQNNWRQMARRAYLKWVYRHVDCAFSVGTNNTKYFVAHGLRPEQIVHAPHAIDNERYMDPTGEKDRSASEWRSQLGIAEDDVCFLFVGKLEEKKAPDLFAKAVASCPENVKAIIVGSGPLEKDLRNNFDPSRFHFIGFQNQSQMPVVYRMADMVVLPSRGPGETWGLALNEGMASERAVLATDRVGAAVDLIRERNGWMIPANNLIELERALQRAADLGREFLREMGKASQEIIVSDWSIARQVDAIASAVSSRSWEKKHDA